MKRGFYFHFFLLFCSGGVTSMNSFLEKFFPAVYRKKMADKTTNQYCQYDSQTLTMFTSSLYLAALLSSLVASVITRTFGRKLSMSFGGILFLTGALLNGFAQKVWMLIVGRILLGFGIGFTNQVYINKILFVHCILLYKYVCVCVSVSLFGSLVFFVFVLFCLEKFGFVLFFFFMFYYLVTHEMFLYFYSSVLCRLTYHSLYFCGLLELNFSLLCWICFLQLWRSIVDLTILFLI